MFGLDDPTQSDIFERVASSPDATYRETVDAFGPNFEGGYFLYRFSDPTFVVANAVVNAVAGTVLADGGRAIDVCGGSGHLTRSLLELSASPPVLADLYFAKVWLARRFTAPGCEPVCCDGNAPLPFARGAFRFAMCTDAFMYIWTKRQFVGELERLIDSGTAGPSGAALIGHTHNARTWSPSHGQPLAPEAYAQLFETIAPRISSRRRGSSPISSTTRTRFVAPRQPGDAGSRPGTHDRGQPESGGLHAPRRGASTRGATGQFRLNPLYRPEPGGPGRDDVRLRLHFPDADYEQEYGACRRYLPDEVTVARALLDALPATTLPEALAELADRRVVLDLPARYY